MAQMIELDGSFGEGGGALVRTALALSMLTKRPFKIKNIRANRPNPGLKAQHLEAINAIKQLAPDTKTSRVELGTTEFWFHPGTIKSGQYDFDIKTAGSITLFLQSILPQCLFAPSKVTITVKGGTCGKWQASVDYLQAILLPNLQRFTNKINLSITKRGYYPKGGGEVILEISPKYKLKSFSDFISLSKEISKNTKIFDYSKQGKLEYIKGFVNSSRNLSEIEVARRVESAAKTSFRGLGVPISIDKGYFPSLSTGGELLLWTVHSKDGEINPTNCIRLAASRLIEKGISSEEIGQSAAVELKNIIRSGAGVDHYLADQLLIYMTMLPGSSIKTDEITNHSRTNIHVIEQFLPIKFEINEDSKVITSTKQNLSKTQTTLDFIQTKTIKKDQIKMEGEKVGNWTKLNSKKIHSGKIFDTFVEKVIDPSGKPGEYSYIKVIPGVRVIPIDGQQNIFLNKEFRYPINSFNFEAIGGGSDHSETKKEAIIRELKEEAGIIAKEIIDLGEIIIDPSTGIHASQHFLAKNLSFQEKNFESTEEIELIKIPLDQAINWCLDGTIKNCETITILFKVKEFLNKEQLN